MTEAEVKEVIRDRGLCGHIADNHVCIQLRHHDDDAHERGWTVVRREVRSAYKRDEREADDVVFDVTDGRPVYGSGKVFTTDNKDHAEWLANTLTRLEL
jgi:hypothetical protein